MKKLEKDIITSLKDDARLTPEDLSKLLDHSVETILSCIQSLEKRGIILGYKAIINESLLDDRLETIQALVEVTISPEKKSGYEAIAKRIYKYPNVIGQYLISGQYDFLIIVEGTSHKEIASFIFNKLAPMDNVTGTNTHFIFKKYKDQGVILDAQDHPNREAVVA